MCFSYARLFIEIHGLYEEGIICKSLKIKIISEVNTIDL